MNEDHANEENIAVAEEDVAVIEDNIEVSDMSQLRNWTAGFVGNIGQLDESVEKWSSYTE